MMMIVLFSACLAAGVSMFCAALLLSCPCVEISIYSTCKRISQKILRNVFKFAMMIADQDMATINCAILRENMEEIYLRGPLGSTDVRIINSYPSKVSGANARAKVAPNVAPAPRQKSRPRRAAPRKSPCTHRAPAPKACPAGSLAASCGHASRSPSSLAAWPPDYFAAGGRRKHVVSGDTEIDRLLSSRLICVTFAYVCTAVLGSGFD
jgi:hypothetical protein